MLMKMIMLVDPEEISPLYLAFVDYFRMNWYFHQFYTRNINQAWFKHYVICCAHALWENGKLPQE